MRYIPFPAVLALALAACSDRPSPVAPVTVPPSVAIASARAAAQSPPTDIDETPFTLDVCSFPLQVQLSGKGKTITLPRGRFIFTSPGVTATLTNLNNQHRDVIGMTGSVHQNTLKNGNVEIVFTGRNGIIPGTPDLPGFVLAIGQFSFVVDGQGNLVQSLQGKGQLIDLCALVA